MTQDYVRDMIARCTQDGGATCIVSCADPHLPEVEVQLARGVDGVVRFSLHTGNLLCLRAHGLLDILISERLAGGWTYEDVFDWVERGPLVDDLAQQFFSAPQAVPGGETKPSDVTRAWMYFHHMCSETKVRKAIEWGKELGLNGLVVPGQPACLVVEGRSGSVRCLHERMQLFSWRDMKLLSVATPAAPVAWKGVRHISSAHPAVFYRGGGSKGRDAADYGSLAEAVCAPLAPDLAALLPVFRDGCVPEADVPFPKDPAADAPEKKQKKKKGRLQ